jgi:hypothetical protein
MYQDSKNTKSVSIMQYEDSGDQSGHEYNEAGLPWQAAHSLVEGMSLPVIQEIPSYGSRHYTIPFRINLHLQNLFL